MKSATRLTGTEISCLIEPPSNFCDWTIASRMNQKALRWVSLAASVASLIGPGLFTLIYARSINRHGARSLPGAAWLLSTLMLLGAAVLMLRVTGTAPPSQKSFCTSTTINARMTPTVSPGARILCGVAAAATRCRGVQRPQVRTGRALQVQHRSAVAEQVLPMGVAVAAAAAVVTPGAVITTRAGQPGATTLVGVRVNRQHGPPPGPAARRR